jgi:CheY-like chemotaxis protein
MIASSPRTTILLVEDNQLDGLYLRRCLRRVALQPEVLLVPTVAAARAVLDERCVDFIFTDWDLPDGTGGQVVQAGLGCQPPVPTIVLTSQDDPRAASALRLGAQDFLQKGDVGVGALERALSHARDRGEWRARELETERLRSLSDRWSAMGRLAAGVAHELNNHLAAAMVGLEVLEESGALAEGEGAAVLEQVRRACEAAGQRCAELRAFTGRGLVRSLDVDLAAAVGLDPARPLRVRGDPDQLGELVGLLQEAVARFGRPQPTVGRSMVGGSSRADADLEWILPVDVDAAVWQVLEFRWEGEALPAGQVQDLFEPLRRSWGGPDAAEGLASAIGVVRGHGGGLAMAHSDGEGRLLLFLPGLGPPSRRPRLAPPAPAVPQSQGLRVVLIDDDDLVRSSLTMGLVRKGVEVTDFSSAPAALTHLETNDADVYIVDLRMPVMTGVEFLRRRRAAGDTTPAVVITGYSEDLPEVAELGPAELLFKPFGARALLDAMEGLRAGRSSA